DAAVVECMSRREVSIGGTEGCESANLDESTSSGCTHRPAAGAVRGNGRAPANGRDETRLRVDRLWLFLRVLLGEFLAAAIRFLLRQIFLPRGDPPAVSVRIDERAHPIAPELLADRHPDLGADADGPPEQR